MTASFTIQPAFKKKQQTANEILQTMQEIAAKFADIPKFEKIEVTAQEYEKLRQEFKVMATLPNEEPSHRICLMGVPVYIKE